MNTQLDLFEGLVLTTEQQEKVDRFIESQAKNAVRFQENNNQLISLLDKSGFVRGVDYDSNFKNHEVTSKREFGYRYDNSSFEHEVTYTNSVGTVYLITNVIRDGEIKTGKSSLEREGDKIMCTGVTDQYRYYKPSSLLSKLKLHNERVINELKHKNKQSVALNNIVNKYQKLYPKAEVTISSDYNRGTKYFHSFPTVSIKFESGSSVIFRLGYGDKMEEVSLHKRYDAQKETAAQSLERFNSQIPK